MAGIYIHIPFCKQACHYCDFHFSTDVSIREEMIGCMIQELLLQKNYLLGEPVHTIYFGGGTPSILHPAKIDLILNTIRENYRIHPDAEITLEGNPDDLLLDKLSSFHDQGINRLSIGVQSFDNSILKFLNRVHSAELARSCIQDARAAGFKNISLDLIYAIPGQSSEVWESNIRKAISLNPEHISCYSLTIEKKTAFGNWYEKGKLLPVEDDLAASQLNTLVSFLESAGYEHYEVSNFCKPGFHSKHNSSYWKQEKYLGIGPSAHSYNSETRQANISNNNLYIRSLRDGKVPYQLEVLTREDRVNEYLLTTLRTSWGTDLRMLREQFGYDILKQKNSYIKPLLEHNLATIDNETLKLTSKGKLLADKISSDLFL